MSPEERQTLGANLPWFLLALFLAFVAYGKLHEFITDIENARAASADLENQVRTLVKKLEVLKRNEAVLEAAESRLSAMVDRLPTSRDTPSIIRFVYGLAGSGGIDIVELKFRKALERMSHSPLGRRIMLEARVRGRYEALRTFFLDLENGAVIGNLVIRTRLEEAGLAKGREGLVNARLLLSVAVTTGNG